MVLALLACTGDDPTDPPIDDLDVVAWFADPGPHRVGYVESSVSWTGGLQQDPRTLRLAAWFPTEATDGDPVTYDQMLPAPDGVLGGVDPVDEALPLLVFSHGHQGFAENSAFLMEHFASHGWLVLAPDHTGNTTFDGPDRETAIYWQRPLDLSAVIDQAPYPLTGEIVVAGHSFGGYTTHAVGGATYAMDALCPPGDDSDFCSTMDPDQEALFRAGLGDDRAQALIAMAAGDAGLFGDGLSAITAPELQMTGGLDPSPDGDVIWAALQGLDRRRVHLPLGGHNVFTAFSGVLDPPGAMDPEEGFRVVRAYALAFAELHARGDDAGRPILDGELPVSDQAELLTP